MPNAGQCSDMEVFPPEIHNADVGKEGGDRELATHEIEKNSKSRINSFFFNEK